LRRGGHGGLGGSKLPRGVIFGWCLAAWQLGSHLAASSTLPRARPDPAPAFRNASLLRESRLRTHTSRPQVPQSSHRSATTSLSPQIPRGKWARMGAWASGASGRSGDPAIGRATHPLAAGRSHAIPSSLCLDRRDKIGVAYCSCCSCCSTLPPHALMPLTSPLHALHPLHSPIHPFAQQYSSGELIESNQLHR
jgi:hypothetical protein